MAPLLLNLDTRWSVLNSTTRPLDLRRKEPQLSKMLGGPQNGSRTSFDKSRSLIPAGNRNNIPTCLARSQVPIPTELSERPQCRLIYFNVLHTVYFSFQQNALTDSFATFPYTLFYSPTCFGLFSAIVRDIMDT
jgi:hypothetical protein